MTDIIRHIIGYAAGILVFILLIPYGLIKLSLKDPIMQIDFPDHILIRILISVPFFMTGLIFAIWSNISLFNIGKGGPADGFNIAISPRTKKLVTEGPYKYSRNPMVFGAFCIYLSIGLFMLSVTCLMILIVFLFPGVYYLRNTEEKRLLKDFGSEYIEYRKKVPMIFPLRCRK